MAIIKCKMCGGDLNVQEGMSVAECEYCGTKQTVPSADSEKKMTLFARANRLRFSCEFDKAAGIYEFLVADFPEEAEAYWGLVLCKYGIEYVDDPATGKKIPTCHRSSFDSVLDDPNFEQAQENADVIAVGTKPEYFNAVWVKNEWSRFLSLMKKDRTKLLLPCYRDMDPYDLPEQLSVLQSYDMGKIGFIQDLIRGINKVLDAEKKPEPVKETVVVQQSGNRNAAALLKRGNMALEDGEWDKADGFFEEVLNQDAECAEAYIGKFLAASSQKTLEGAVQVLLAQTKDAKTQQRCAAKPDTKRVQAAIAC